MPLRSESVGTQSEITVTCDARWLMAYSAGVGLSGATYFDTQRDGGVAAHPLFPVAPEWLLLTRIPDPFGLQLTRDERASGVHASHRLAVHSPLRAGEDVRIVAEIVGVGTIRSGAYATVRFDATAADGSPLWTSWMGTIYRGIDVVGDDRPVALDPLPRVSLTNAASTTVDIGARAAHVYTECARIWNPIHTDVSVARRAGLPDIILHGTATLAHGINVVIDRVGLEPDEVSGVSGSFRAMVLMPNTLDVRVSDHPDAQACAFEVIVDGQPAVKDGLVTYRRG
jgi:acyl dehydratase